MESTPTETTNIYDVRQYIDFKEKLEKWVDLTLIKAKHPSKEIHQILDLLHTAIVTKEQLKVGKN